MHTKISYSPSPPVGSLSSEHWLQLGRWCEWRELCSLRRAALLLLAVFAMLGTSAWAQPTRISVNSAGVQSDGNSYESRTSADGRYVAFTSVASNLVAGDTNGASDVFVRDLTAGTTTRVSVSSAGVEGNDSSNFPSISADGRYVVFTSSATNLVAGDTNGTNDIFVRDLTAGTTTRVSVSSGGVEAVGNSGGAAISANGRYVTFYSDAANLVAGDVNGRVDVFVRDLLVGGTTTLVSVDSAGVQGNGHSYNSSISADGRYIAFDSDSTNLVAGDTNGANDVFVRDTAANTTVRLSLSSGAVQGNGNSSSPGISADGRYVTYFSDASNLVAGDTNAANDVFLSDRTTGATTRISVGSGGLQANGGSVYPQISGNGRYVVYFSAASNLVAGDANGANDTFVYDTATGITTRVSVGSGGIEGNAASNTVSVSADGRYVVFFSFASNLIAGDTNAASDVFLAANASAFAAGGSGSITAVPALDAPGLLLSALLLAGWGAANLRKKKLPKR